MFFTFVCSKNSPAGKAHRKSSLMPARNGQTPQHSCISSSREDTHPEFVFQTLQWLKGDCKGLRAHPCPPLLLVTNCSSDTLRTEMWLSCHFPVLRGGTLGCVAWQREDVNAHQAGARLGGFSMLGFYGGFSFLSAWQRLSCHGLTGAILVWFDFLQVLAWLASFHRQDKACLSLCPGWCQPGWQGRLAQLG